MKRAAVPGATKKYHIHTFGCQMNSADSERMAGVLETLGYTCVEDQESADVLVFNTCSIREKAEDKVYSALGPSAGRKRRQGMDVKIVVAGCVAQQEGEALLRRVPEIDIVMGPQFANKIGDLLERADQGNQVVATEHVPVEEDLTAPRRDSDITAWWVQPPACLPIEALCGAQRQLRCTARRSRLQGQCDLRVQRKVQLLRRAFHQRPGAVPRAGRHQARDDHPRGGRVQGGNIAGAERRRVR